MKFVQYKQDVIFKEGRMFMRGTPVNVEDNYAIGVFSTDPQFEKFKEKLNEEKAKEAAPPPVLVGKECSKCHKIIHQGWYMHQKWCKG